MQVTMTDHDMWWFVILLRHEIEAHVLKGCCAEMSQLAGAWALLIVQQATSHMVGCFLLDPAYRVTFLKQLKKKYMALGEEKTQQPAAGADG